MAIVFICRDCRGKGRIERKVLGVKRQMKCRTCNGTGRKKYVKKQAAGAGTTG